MNIMEVLAAASIIMMCFSIPLALYYMMMACGWLISRTPVWVIKTVLGAIAWILAASITYSVLFR